MPSEERITIFIHFRTLSHQLRGIVSAIEVRINRIIVASATKSRSDFVLSQTEYNAELNYGLHVTDWLTVRPNLQFVRHPGGVKAVDNAWVAGLKVQATF